MKLPKAIWRRENFLSGARWGKIPNWPEPSWAAGSEGREGWEVSLVISLIGDWSSLSQVLWEPGWVLHQCLAQRATQEVFDLLKYIKEDLYLALKEEQYLAEGRGSMRKSRGMRMRVCVAVGSCVVWWAVTRLGTRHWTLTGGEVETSVGSDSSGSALHVWGRAVPRRARWGSRARARRGGNHSSH